MDKNIYKLRLFLLDLPRDIKLIISDIGNIIYSYSHNKEKPISIFNIEALISFIGIIL